MGVIFFVIMTLMAVF